MNFFTSIKTCFGKYATFTGRARRSEFWWLLLANFIVSCIPVVNFIWGIAVIVPTIAAGVRRLHDIGKSGWWYLLAIVPIANFFLLYLLAKDSQPGENEYGPNPKA